jgi:hypothetical protein
MIPEIAAAANFSRGNNMKCNFIVKTFPPAGISRHSDETQGISMRRRHRKA